MFVNDNVRVISDVPQDKLEQVVKDLQYEVGKDNIRVSLQPNNLWKVEYSVTESMLPNTGSLFSSSGSF